MQCSFEQRLKFAGKERTKTGSNGENKRERQHRGKSIASIYKPERDALDWVMENKTERKKNKGGVKKDKTGRWVKKMKRWMDTEKSRSCQ